MRKLWGIGSMALIACGAGTPGPAQPASTAGASSFDDDVAFLRRHGELQVLESPGGGRVAVSAKYQGRVMTSAVQPGGRSLGWISRKFIEAGKTGTQFDNYGGEDRFWIGPEAGQYGLYFAPGAPFTFEHWQVPEALQTGEWATQERRPDSITFERPMTLTNYAGTRFQLNVRRTIRLLGAQEAEAMLGAPLTGTRWVGFESINRITNTGHEPWTEDKGLLSIWILAMFPPASDGWVILPFDPKGQGPIVHDGYFGKVPADRLQVHEAQGYLLFRCDGRYRSKIGLGPSRALPVMGSYIESAHELTVVRYDKPQGAARYVNSMWEQQADPYGGDVVNSYNDGPTEPGKPALGGFYELESSSPAAALAPGGELVHRHATIHLEGDSQKLKAIADRVLRGSPENLGTRN